MNKLRFTPFLLTVLLGVFTRSASADDALERAISIANFLPLLDGIMPTSNDGDAEFRVSMEIGGKVSALFDLSGRVITDSNAVSIPRGRFVLVSGRGSFGESVSEMDLKLKGVKAPRGISLLLTHFEVSTSGEYHYTYAVIVNGRARKKAQTVRATLVAFDGKRRVRTSLKLDVNVTDGPAADYADVFATYYLAMNAMALSDARMAEYETLKAEASKLLETAKQSESSADVKRVWLERTGRKISLAREQRSAGRALQRRAELWVAILRSLKLGPDRKVATAAKRCLKLYKNRSR